MSGGASSDSTQSPPSHILVVDDDHDTRAVIKQSLTALGHVVSEAVDGVDAQEKCGAFLPDMIVLDVMMPRMTGMEFLKWFREAYAEPFVPVLLLTALTTIEQRVEGLVGGADEYLAKPFNFRELQARVHALLRIASLTNTLLRRTKDLETANARLAEMQNALVAKERELVAAQMAGTAAHTLGQPLTAALLHCRVLSGTLTPLLQTESETNRAAAEQAVKTAQSIQTECELMSAMLAKLKTTDGNSVTDYVGGVKILELKE